MQLLTCGSSLCRWTIGDCDAFQLSRGCVVHNHGWRSHAQLGVTDEAICHAIRLIETDDGMFIIGADHSGQLLELVARPTEDGELRVFHAMPLRPTSARRYLS